MQPWKWVLWVWNRKSLSKWLLKYWYLTSILVPEQGCEPYLFSEHHQLWANVNFTRVIQVYVQLCTEMKQTVINACRKGDYHTESFWDPFHLHSFQFYTSIRKEKARRKTKRKNWWMQLGTVCNLVQIAFISMLIMFFTCQDIIFWWKVKRKSNKWRLGGERENCLISLAIVW